MAEEIAIAVKFDRVISGKAESIKLQKLYQIK